MNTTRLPTVSVPSITWRAPTHTTAAAATATAHIPHHCGGADRDYHIHHPRVERLQGVETEPRVEAALARGHEPAVLLVLAGEGLDDPHRAHRPLHDAV